MTFAPKPGLGSLFRNDKKSKDIQPDYKGSLCLEDGSTVQLAGWIKEGRNGKYLSLKSGSILPPTSESPARDGAPHNNNGPSDE
jgi:hypothetical protein